MYHSITMQEKLKRYGILTEVILLLKKRFLDHSVVFSVVVICTQSMQNLVGHRPLSGKTCL